MKLLLCAFLLLPYFTEQHHKAATVTVDSHRKVAEDWLNDSTYMIEKCVFDLK